MYSSTPSCQMPAHPSPSLRMPETVSAQKTASDGAVLADELSDGDALMEHASWHLAKTVPMILGNRLWPTARLKGGGGGGVAGSRGLRAGSGSKRRSELRGLVAELEACDPRVLEIVGLEVRVLL